MYVCVTICAGGGKMDVCVTVCIGVGKMDVCMCDSLYKCGGNGCMYV